MRARRRLRRAVMTPMTISARPISELDERGDAERMAKDQDVYVGVEDLLVQLRISNAPAIMTPGQVGW